MEFDYCIGNPPYQASDNNLRLFPFMYLEAQNISNCVEMIFPNTWRETKNTNGLSIMNTIEVKKDKQIVFIEDEYDAFKGVSGAKHTNIVMWKKGYDNGLNGSQLIIDEKGNKNIEKLPIGKEDVIKPKEITDIVEKVNKLNEPKIIKLVSARKPYGFEADPLDNPSKYHINLKQDYFKGSVRLFGKKKEEGRTSYYIERKKLPKESNLLDKHKLFIVKAWGNMDEKKGFLGGSYAQLIIAKPLDCCSEMYIEIGPFKNELETKNAYKYFNTKFLRAVFYNRKMSQNTARDTYTDIPIQDFSNKSDIDWSTSIKDIDKQLYKKYKLTKNEQDFIEQHIKEMD